MLAKTGISRQEVKEVLSTKGTVHHVIQHAFPWAHSYQIPPRVTHQWSVFFNSKYSISEESKAAGFPLGLILYTRHRIKPHYLQIQVISSHPPKHSLLPKYTFKHLKHTIPGMMDTIYRKIWTLPKHNCLSACSYSRATKMFMSINHKSFQGWWPKKWGKTWAM